MKLRTAMLLAIAAMAASLPARGLATSLGTGTFAIENGRIVTVSGATIEKGTVVIRDGKIAAVGATVDVPSDAKRIDATGLSVYPGMIDSATQIGLLEIGSISAGNDIAELGDYNPHLRAYEAFNPNSEHVAVARVAGITSVVSMPAGGTISGQPLVVDLAGDTVDDMVLRPSVGVIFNFPSEAARSAFDSGNYQVRKSTSSDAKKARDKKLDEVRALLRDAEAYSKAMDAYAKDPSLPPAKRDLKLAGILPVLRGELPFIVRTADERDVRAAVAFADEMRVKMILVASGTSDVANAASLLAEKKIPVVLGSMYTLPGRNDDRYDQPQQTAAALGRAGVLYAFSTGDYANVRDLPYNAAMAVAYGGLSKDDALKAITLWPARIWGVADKVGSIEVGKFANLIVTTGDPLEVMTDVKHVFIEGRQIPLVSRQTQFYDRYKSR
jgi:imidazolonepropionase-like amidohydrolase